MRIARYLEAAPVAKDAAELRKWALTWLIDHPELDFNVCTSYLAQLIKSGRPYSSEINLQTIVSSGAYVIEHPDKMHDNEAVNVAGLEGALKVYESLLTDRPDVKWKFLDGLVDRRNQGTLKAYVHEEKGSCK